jgi:hypothetical protein
LGGATYARFGLVNPGTDNTGYIGSTSNNPFLFYTVNTERMRISETGNVGIGTTPSLWANGTENALQIKKASIYEYGNYEVGLQVNAFYNTDVSPAGWKYISTGTQCISQLQLSGGDLSYNIANPGTAGCGITWSTKFNITRAGTTVIRPNCIGLSDIADRTLLLGSRPGNADIVSFGFDVGGTWKAGFDYKGSDGQLEWWTNNGSWCRRIMYTPTGIACFSNTVCMPMLLATECVGIGTTTPKGRLHLTGIYNGAQNTLNLENNWPNTHYTSLINFWAYYNSTDPMAVIEAGQDVSATNAGVIMFKTMDAGAAPVTRMRITPTGAACFACQVCAPAGVKFGNGSSTLNYYEQGTWTPRVKAGDWTTNQGGENAGWYIRVGNIVTVGGTLSWSGGTGSQNATLQIVCLPFASGVGSGHRSVGQFGAPAPGSIGFKCSGTQMTLVNDPGQSGIYIIENYMNGSYLTYTHNPTIANAGTVYGFQITYQL